MNACPCGQPAIFYLPWANACGACAEAMLDTKDQCSSLAYRIEADFEDALRTNEKIDVERALAKQEVEHRLFLANEWVARHQIVVDQNCRRDRDFAVVYVADKLGNDHGEGHEKFKAAIVDILTKRWFDEDEDVARAEQIIYARMRAAADNRGHIFVKSRPETEIVDKYYRSMPAKVAPDPEGGARVLAGLDKSEDIADLERKLLGKIK